MVGSTCNQVYQVLVGGAAGSGSGAGNHNRNEPHDDGPLPPPPPITPEMYMAHMLNSQCNTEQAHKKWRIFCVLLHKIREVNARVAKLLRTAQQFQRFHGHQTANVPRGS
jgi:hypothetical protein